MADVLNLEAESLEIRHLKIAVETLGGVHAHGKAGKLTKLVVVSVAEEIGEGSFNGRIFVAVEIYAQNEPTAHGEHVCDPEMLDSTLSLDVGKNGGLTGLNDKVRIHLPALTEVACSPSGAAVSCHTAASLLTCKIFGGYGKGADIFLGSKIRKHDKPPRAGHCTDYVT